MIGIGELAISYKGVAVLFFCVVIYCGIVLLVGKLLSLNRTNDD